MTFEIDCLECGGSGFFGNNGPTVESRCGACRGSGVLVEDGLVNVRPVHKSVLGFGLEATRGVGTEVRGGGL
jgi:DnaJ-class molecular chaperone